ncbi:3-deoxy-manno-octulosonate cytidylyltransferase [bacterium]|nr:3-deoxy-manno-octulosonate cytidylyltransferase [bacterium]
MKVAGIIPARLASSRLPNKPLQDLAGKTLIERVYENALGFGLDQLIVATDSEQIAEVIERIGGKVQLTPAELPSGTYRCAYLAPQVDADIIINIQGDEPFLLKQQVSDLLNAFADQATEIATLYYHLHEVESLQRAATVKVVMDKYKNALYFSRSPIPFVRNETVDKWTRVHRYFKHIGVYAFRKNTLLQVAQYDMGSLEKAESLEQLTWLENGHRIKMVETTEECISIDTAEDLQKALAYFN